MLCWAFGPAHEDTLFKSSSEDFTFKPLELEFETLAGLGRFLVLCVQYCPLGSISKAGATVCTSCPLGQTTTNYLQSNCTFCPLGTRGISAVNGSASTCKVLCVYLHFSTVLTQMCLLETKQNKCPACTPPGNLETSAKYLALYIVRAMWVVF